MREDGRELPGHHDVAMAGVSAGVPRAVAEQVHTVDFNDSPGLEARLEELAGAGRPAACVIMEPAMTSRGLVLPEAGYLEAVRDLTLRHGALLLFDEVKTGLTVAPGGATERFGVTPDMVTLAKALGAGLPSGAIGMTERRPGSSRTAACASSAPSTAIRSAWPRRG